MEVKIEDIELLLPKKVPKHGKVSGIKSERGAVRVIIPKKDTKLLLTVYDPSELIVRNVTPDGKLLGLTNFVGKTIYVIDQKEDAYRKEAGTVPLFEKEDEVSEKTLRKLFKKCEEYNLDPADFLEKAFKSYKLSEESKKASKEGKENE
jgi:hypothetical protein